LRPKKAKDFIPEVAEKLSLSESLVGDLMLFYWQEVRMSLSSLKHQRVHVTNLGDFVVKHWKIDEKIEHLEKWEDVNKLKGLQKITERFKIAEKLFDLRSLKTMMEEENQRKELIKQNKNESGSQHLQDLETQE
jgi:hypothetical protein